MIKLKLVILSWNRIKEICGCSVKNWVGGIGIYKINLITPCGNFFTRVYYVFHWRSCDCALY